MKNLSGFYYFKQNISAVALTKINLILFGIFFFNCLLADEFVIPKTSYSITSCDLDLDMDFDIVVGSSTNNSIYDTITLLINDGQGSFSTKFLNRENYYLLKLIDMNNDELPDILVGLADLNYGYYVNLGNNTFSVSPEIIHHSYSNQYEDFEIVDIDNDDDDDIIFFKKGPDTYWGILYNDGAGNFSSDVIYSSSSNIMSLSVGNLNDDDFYDILITTGSIGVIIFENLGSSFSLHTLTNSSSFPNSFIVDYNFDTLNDIFLFLHSGFPSGNSLLLKYKNLGNMLFSSPENNILESGIAIKEIKDINLDNTVDYIFTKCIWSGCEDSLFISLNDSAGNPIQLQTINIPVPDGIKISLSDYDSNGFDDIAMTAYGQKDLVTIMYNDNGYFYQNPIVNVDDTYNDDYKPEIVIFPNPCSYYTCIKFKSYSIENLIVKIYDMKGDLIQSYNQSFMDLSSSKIFTWDLNDRFNNKVKNGTYLINIIIGKFSSTRKIIILDQTI
jgi:hypothetical protein